MSFKNSDSLKKYLNPVFFETGTFLGGGTKAALESGFPKVITIEIQEHLYNQCINGDPTGNGEDLVKEIKDGKVSLHLGDSKNIMWNLISNVNDRMTFWLDAHIDGGNYVQGLTPNVQPCSIYEEIEIISKHPIKTHTILIDDLRIMAGSHSSGYGWGYGIDIDEIKKKILNINPKYVFSYEDGYQSKDILVAMVPDVKEEEVNFII